jgi:hypothetical protein
MPRSVVKQPNGKYAIFSTIVDNFVMLDATKEHIIQEFVDSAAKRAREIAEECIEKAEGRGTLAHTHTYESALEVAEVVHGPDDETVKMAKERLLPR